MTSSSSVSERESDQSVNTAQVSSQDECRECGGRLVEDREHGETVCSDCGLVVAEGTIDRGPEWRSFEPTDDDGKSRVGAPMSELIHDKGLSTNIGWRNKDAYGRSLSPRQREKMQRLRTWNERFRTRNSRERNLKHALGEIDRMASALGLPDNVRETAGVIYRRALDEDLLPGRSIEGMATASVYAGLRLDGLPRTIEQVANVSRIPEIEFTRAYRYLDRELGLKIPPTNPMDFLGKLCSDVGCEERTERRAKEALQMAMEENVHSGKHPAGLAASALYVAGQLQGEEITQSTLSEAASVSEITIRNRYREVHDALEADP